MSNKLDLKEIKKPDRFLSFLQGGVSHIEKNPKILLGIIGGILAVLAVSGGVWRWNDKKNEAARSEYYLVSKALQEELKKIREDQKAKLNVSSPQKKSKQTEAPDHLQSNAPIEVDEKLSTQVDGMKNFIPKFPGTLSAFLAQVELGNLYFENEKYENAVEWFRSASRSSPNKIDEGLVLVSLGYTYENLKQFDKAIESFEGSLKSFDSSQFLSPKDKTQKSMIKGDILLALGRSYAQAKIPEKAQEIYSKIIQEFPNTPFAEKAESNKLNLGN